MRELPSLKHMQMWGRHVASIIAGALLPLSFAPYNLWPVGIIATSLLALILCNQNGKQCIRYSFLFGLGMYANGVYWIYGAIHDFGNTAAPLAFVMMAIFITGMALIFSLPFYVYGRILSSSRTGYVFGFAAIWTLGEWIRTWLLTGFPWLFVGYAHIDTWLAGWAPVLGVLGVGFIAVLTGTLLADLVASSIRKINPSRPMQLARFAFCSLILSALWFTGWQMKGHDWGTKQEEQLSVAIVQPNIPLEIKWNPLYRGFILDVLREETQPLWGKDLIVWPEAAVPLMYNEAAEFFAEIEQQALEHDSALITGVLYDDAKPRTYFNAITGLGNASGLYFKKRLVPFGEYVPLEKYLRGLIDFFDLPNSIITAGPWEQDILHYKNYKISPSICYEIVYPDLVADMAQGAQLLITISNDAWFGDSIGPKQHFQMAQMRALETHRFVIRGTNTGISGFINPKGQVMQYGNQFARESIDSTLGLISGSTPFMRWGSLPIIIFAMLLIALHCVPLILRQQPKYVNLPS